MTTSSEPVPDSGLDRRVSNLETGQQSILSKLDQLLGGSRQPPAEPERPEVNIVDEIRRQLDERDRKAARTKTEAAPPAAAEPEQPPKPPVRGITRALWGGDE